MTRRTRRFVVWAGAVAVCAAAAAGAQATITMTAPGQMRVDLPSSLKAAQSITISDALPFTVHDGEIDLQLQTDPTGPAKTVAKDTVHARAFRISWTVPGNLPKQIVIYLRLIRNGKLLAVSQPVMATVLGGLG